MGRAAKRERLNRAFESHARSLQDTLQMFEKKADSSLEKVDWSQVTKIGDEISKQATVAGMLWSGEAPDVKELEDNMAVYCNVLQGFLLLCHGSTVGAGPTLLACIQTSAKQVTKCSLSFFKEAISIYGCHGSDKKASIPKLSGSVWEACDALQKTPSTNSVAVGRAITKVALSIKDVLREMRELKPAASNSVDVSPSELSNSACETGEEDDLSEDEFGIDLSPEEMNIAKLVTGVVSDTLIVIKELIRFVTCFLKRTNQQSSPEDHSDALERILKSCKEIGGQIDELGACVYPPQEVSSMNTASKKIIDGIDAIEAVVGILEGSSKDLIAAIEGLKGSSRNLQTGFVSVDGDLAPEMGKLVL